MSKSSWQIPLFLLCVSPSLLLGQAARAASPVIDSIAAGRNAFSNGNPVNSITLHGQVRSISGMGSQQGSIELQADRSGATDVRIHLPDGDRQESQTSLVQHRSCTWKDPAGQSHVVAPMNCFTALPWFLPQLVLQTGSASLLSSVDAGLITDSSGIHILQRHNVNLTSDPKQQIMQQRIATWSAADLNLSPVTNLPIALEYKVYSEKNPRLVIVSKTAFSDYRSISGVQIPFHIQRYFNGALTMDITISEAAIQ